MTFQILGIANDWYAHAIARVLANAQDLSAKFDNFVFKDLFMEISSH